MQDITDLVGEAAAILCSRQLKLVTAESCTGGWVAQQATALGGSSSWYEGGFVSYSNAAKQAMLGVSSRSLLRYGAVSQEVVQEMIAGALAATRAQVAVAVSGIAGPGGATRDKPVGTIWIGWGLSGEPVSARCFHFNGDREQIRWQTVIAAYQGLLDLLQNKIPA